MFGTDQSIFTPQAPPQSSEDIRGRSTLEELTSQLFALQDTVRILAEDKRQNTNYQNPFPVPPSPTSFRSFISTSSPIEDGSASLDFQSKPRHSTSIRGGTSRGTHFSAGDLRELLNPRKPVEEPRLSSISVASAVEFLTKWHEHGASVLGTTVPTHLSLLISPSALQTIADRNKVLPDVVMSAENAQLCKCIATAVSFGKARLMRCWRYHLTAPSVA
jgi:hypothetical protein